jgi:hypothetical protein
VTTAVKSAMSSSKVPNTNVESSSVSRIRAWVTVTRPTIPKTDTGRSNAKRRSIPAMSPVRTPWVMPASRNSNNSAAPIATVVP